MSLAVLAQRDSGIIEFRHRKEIGVDAFHHLLRIGISDHSRSMGALWARGRNGDMPIS